MSVTLAHPSDLPELCSLLEILFSQESEFKPNVEAQRRGLVQILDDEERGDILVFREENEILAMVNILYTVSTFLGTKVAILEDMVVSPRARGKGIGSTLIEEAMVHARNKGCGRITLLTDQHNQRAQRFYAQHGFEASSMVVYRRPL